VVILWPTIMAKPATERHTHAPARKPCVILAFQRDKPANAVYTLTAAGIGNLSSGPRGGWEQREQGTVGKTKENANAHEYWVPKEDVPGEVASTRGDNEHHHGHLHSEAPKAQAPAHSHLPPSQLSGHAAVPPLVRFFTFPPSFLNSCSFLAIFGAPQTKTGTLDFPSGKREKGFI
jgi:hypothetical protein